VKKQKRTVFFLFQRVSVASQDWSWIMAAVGGLNGEVGAQDEEQAEDRRSVFPHPRLHRSAATATARFVTRRGVLRHALSSGE